MAKSTNLREFIESISYPRRETYNRDEVDYEIETRLILKIVDSLPTGNDIREDKIYLLVDTYNLDNDDDSISYYDLWVRLNGEWVQIDKLDFTIENYFTKDEIIGLLNEKADVNHGHDTSEIDNTEIYLNINPTLIDNQKDLNNAIDIAIGSKAPINHRSTATTYGVSDENYYGHSKASSTTPLMDGTASIGSETSSFARGNHRHPTDTSRASADHIHGNISNDGKISSSINANIKNIVITDTNNNVNTTHELNGVNIADNSITESKLADNSVTSAKIVDGTIVNGDLANATIETGKIKDGAVTSDKILNGTIVNDDIANTTITGGKLVNSTITATQLANNSVTTTKIKDGNVSLVKLNSDVYDTTDGGTSNSNKLITSGAVYNGLSTKADSDDVYLKTETLNTNEITRAILDGVSNVELFELKTSLPTTNIKGNKFYLIPNNENIDSNVYDIYIYVNNNWEQIDSLEFDISDYPTTDTVNGLLENYVTKLQSTANMNVVTGSDKKLTLEAKNSHSHGNITSAGKIGSTQDLPLITGSGGTVTTGSFGTTAKTFAEGNHTHTKSSITDFPSTMTPSSHEHNSTQVKESSELAVIGTSANANQHEVNTAINTKLSNIITGDVDLSGTHTHTKSQITDYVVDSSLSSSSTNPVQNKVINTALNGKVSTSDSRLTDSRVPKFTSVPASETNIVDLNTFNTGGFYFCSADVNAKWIIHCPYSNGTSTPYDDNKGFFLLVETWGASANFVKQTLTYYHDNKTFVRTKKGNADAQVNWTAWTELSKDTTYTPSSSTPKIDNFTGSVGTSTKYAREDHIHPIIYNTCGNINNTDWYLKVMTITVTGNYFDKPISFDVQARRTRLHHVELSFLNVSSTDPQVRKFIVQGGDSRMWLMKESESTWSLIVKKQELYDSIDITNLQYGNGFTITYPNEAVAELPTSNLLEALYERDNVGVNLLVGSKEFTGNYLSGQNSNTPSPIEVSERYNGCKVLRLDNNSTFYQDIGWEIPKEWLANGEVYTLSFWAKTDATHGYVKTFFYQSNVTSKRLKSNGLINDWTESSSYSDGGTQFYLNQGWTRYYVTYQLLDTGTFNSNKKITIRLNTSSTANNNIYVAGVKFEKGDQATRYTESPFDSRLTASQNICTDATGKIITENKNNHSHGSISASGVINDDISSVNKLLVTDSSNNIKTISTLPLSKVTHQDISGKAPTNHKSTATTYGVGDATNYGHVKVDTALSNSSTNTVQNKEVYRGLYTPTNISNTNINFNDYTTPGMWNVWATEEVNNTNRPDNQGGLLIVKAIPNGVVQVLIQYYIEEAKIFYRTYHTSNGWKKWSTMTNSIQIDANENKTKDLNNYTVGGFYYVQSNVNATYVSNKPENRNTAFWLLVEDWGASSYTKQTLTYYDTYKTYIRVRNAGTWGAWKEITTTASSTEPKVDNYKSNGVVGTSTDYARADHQHTRLYSWCTGGVSTACYVNILQFNVNQSWNDRPITLTIQQRAKQTPTYMSIKLTNTDISSANYSIDTFVTWGTNTTFYLRQVDTNTWNLMAYKVANDGFYVVDLFSGNSSIQFSSLNTSYGTTAPTNTTSNPLKTSTYIAGATPFGTSANTVAQGNHNHSGTYVDTVTDTLSNAGTVLGKIKANTTEKGTISHPKPLSSALSTESLYKITANTDGHITKGTSVGIDSTSGGTSGSSSLITSGAVNSGLSGKAPTSHASTSTTYGRGSATNYGHAKAFNGTTTAIGTTASNGTDDGIYARGDHTHNITKATVTGLGISSSDHVHGSITNDGKVGSNANYFLYTGTGGAVTSKEKIGNITTSGAIGTTSGNVITTTTNGVLQSSTSINSDKVTDNTASSYTNIGSMSNGATQKAINTNINSKMGALGTWTDIIDDVIDWNNTTSTGSYSHCWYNDVLKMLIFRFHYPFASIQSATKYTWDGNNSIGKIKVKDAYKPLSLMYGSAIASRGSDAGMGTIWVNSNGYFGGIFNKTFNNTGTYVDVYGEIIWVLTDDILE